MPMGTTTNTALPLHGNDVTKRRRRTPFAALATRSMIQPTSDGCLAFSSHNEERNRMIAVKAQAAS